MLVFTNNSYYVVVVTDYDDNYRPHERKLYVKCDYFNRWLRQSLTSDNEIQVNGMTYLHFDGHSPRAIQIDR